jgi:hypothetical protein
VINTEHAAWPTGLVGNTVAYQMAPGEGVPSKTSTRKKISMEEDGIYSNNRDRATKKPKRYKEGIRGRKAVMGERREDDGRPAISQLHGDPAARVLRKDFD